MKVWQIPMDGRRVYKAKTLVENLEQVLDEMTHQERVAKSVWRSGKRKILENNDWNTKEEEMESSEQ